jgi:hypothetical protein
MQYARKINTGSRSGPGTGAVGMRPAIRPSLSPSKENVAEFFAFEYELTEPLGPLEQHGQRICGVVGDLRIFAGSQEVYRDSAFPLVELALALTEWAEHVRDSGGSFGFAPSAGPPGHILFRILAGSGGWNVVSIQQELPGSMVFTLDRVLEEVWRFVHELDREVREEHGFGVLELRR